jgi:hypothetical protein
VINVFLSNNCVVFFNPFTKNLNEIQENIDLMIIKNFTEEYLKNSKLCKNVASIYMLIKIAYMARGNTVKK